MIAWLHGFLGAPAQWEGVRGSLADPERERGGAPGAPAIPRPERVGRTYSSLPFAHAQGPSAEPENFHAPWLPGHGPSPFVLPGASFDAVVDALAPSLAQATVLVGYSLGARLALSFALRHPASLRAVVLVGGTPGLADPAERTQRAAADDALAATIARDGLDAFVDRWESLPLFTTQRALPPAVLAAQRSWRTQHEPAAIAWALSALSTGRMPPLWDALATAPFAIHAVTGERDEKFTRIAEEMAQRGGGRVTHHRVADAGHNVALEDPAAVARVVRAARTQP